jgi:hypothetical protein
VAAAPRTIAANPDGSVGGEPVHDAGTESADITAPIPDEAVKLPAGPVVDDFPNGVPATSGNMTDLVRRRLASLCHEGRRRHGSRAQGPDPYPSV